MIEFGINDTGAPRNGSTSTTGDKGRADCPGAGNQTCITVVKMCRPPSPSPFFLVLIRIVLHLLFVSRVKSIAGQVGMYICRKSLVA